jgi:O-antigen ligase
MEEKMKFREIGKRNIGTAALLLCMLVSVFFAYAGREDLSRIDVFFVTLPIVPLFVILALAGMFCAVGLFIRGMKIDLVCVLLLLRLLLHCVPLISDGIHAKFAVNFVTSGLCLAFYWLGLNYSRDKHFLLKALKLIFLLITLQTVFEAFLGDVTFFGSTYDYKNDLILPFGGSNAIAAILIPCFAYIFCAEKRWSMCIPYTVLLLFVIVLTKSRGGLIVALCALCLAVLFRLRISVRRMLIFGAAGGILAGLLIALLIVTPWGSYIFLNSSSTVFGRFALWEEHLAYFAQNPFFGLGFTAETVTNNPHNFLVHILSRSGVLGLELAGILGGCAVMKLYGAFRDKYVMAGVCFLVCMMCHSLVEIVLFSYNYDMIFWFVLGGTVSRAAFVKAQAKTVNAAVTVRNND